MDPFKDPFKEPFKEPLGRKPGSEAVPPSQRIQRGGFASPSHRAGLGLGGSGVFGWGV